MALRYYANAPATTLASSCTGASTSLNVTSVTGLPITYPYTLILDRGEAAEEVVEVTNGSGTALTVTRGVDSTTAFAHDAGATVEHGISARDIRESNTHINASEGVHGLGGTSAVVGEDEVQTLTNKDLTDPTNTFPSTLATDTELAAEVATLEAADSALDTRLDSAESSITTNTTDIATAQGDITAIEADVATHETRLDTAESGSWTALTFGTNWSARPGYYAPAYKVVGNKVELRGAADRSGSPTGGEAPFGTLPLAIRPASEVSLAVATARSAAANTPTGRLDINTNGTNEFWFDTDNNATWLSLDGQFYYTS